jgi:hypothetical protein
MNPMKYAALAVSILLFLFNPASILAEELVVTDKPSEVVTRDKSSATENTDITQPTPGKGIRHTGKGQHGKGCHGGGKHGKGGHGGGKHGKGGHGGGKHGKGGHGAGKHGKVGHDKHREVVQRLDMIEARMAKIEAMLETLIRR